jgi:hypothetical protein
MARILLTIGPQGAGKSTFCKSVMECGVDGVAYASRDAYLEYLYGKLARDPYAGVFAEGMKRFYVHVAKLAEDNRVVLVESFAPNQGILTDLKTGVGLRWNYPDYRSLEWEALWFVTPNDQCAKWFVERAHTVDCSETNKSFTYSCKRHDNERFRITTDNIIERNFDTVWTIDPRQLTLFPHSEILGLRG